MVSSNALRKKCGCWACIHCKVNNSVQPAVMKCNSEDSEIRNACNGWDSAFTCRGFRMRPYAMEVSPESEGNKE